MQARMSIPLGEVIPLEARLGIETDGLREDYFVFSTEFANSESPAFARWLAWSARLDYRSSAESPPSARAEHRVGLKWGGRDTFGVIGRIEDRNLAVQTSPWLDLVPAGEVFWSHRWLPQLESIVKAQQVLPDLQAMWLAEPGAGLQLEADLRAELTRSTRIDLRGTTTLDWNLVGIQFQLEYLIGTPAAPSQNRFLGPDPDQHAFPSMENLE
jgi:hypothetical protein